MKILSAEFDKSAVKPQHYPDPNLPEIAFAGRSNVGKSSLINTLVNRKNLVRTSNTPGRTQLINFFTVNRAITLVDLPGYGYAKVPMSIKKEWGKMIETYLATRETLAAVVLILDIRRTPREEEKEFLAWLSEYGRPCLIVVTKADKLSKNEQKKQVALIAKTLNLLPEHLVLFSAKTRLGRDQVWNALAALAGWTWKEAGRDEQS